MTSNAHLPDENLLEPTHEEEEHLRACTSCQRRRETQASIRAALSKLDRTAIPNPAAADLLARAGARTKRRRRWLALGFAAAAVALLVGLSVTLRRPRSHLAEPLRDELALDHLHYAPLPHPAQVVSSDPTVVATGLSEKLGRPVSVPTWEATTLIGGRSCRIQNEWVSLVLYERAGRRISFFELPNARLSEAGCDAGQGGLSVCAAPRRGGGAFVAVADLPSHEVSRLVRLVGGS